jgi:hypothetical protein
MTVTKQILDTIFWRATTVFPKESLVVLECENYAQSLNLVKLLLANDFNFKMGTEENGFPAFVITFTNTPLVKYFIAMDDKLFKDFDDGKIHYITAGFDIDGELACLEDRISIKGMQFSSAN